MQKKIRLSIVAAVLLLGACTKYNNPAANFELDKKTSDSAIVKKVLLINIDAAPGSEVKAVMPATIASLLPNSKYSWTGLSDLRTNDATTWASMATGVNIGKHQITDATFQPTRDPNNPSISASFYPTFFFRILQLRPLYKTLSISSWSALNSNLMIHSDAQITPANDKAVKDSAVVHLQNDNQILTVVDFREVEAAGLNSGFSATNPEFANALKTTDGYIGELLAALKKRKSYNKENWLIIITSNHGATGKTFGGSSDPERNLFTLFYNTKYKGLELKGKTLNSPRFKSDVSATLTGDPTGLYNIGSGSMTVQMKMKLNPFSDGTYNAGGSFYFMLGKMTNGGKRGFGLFRQRLALSVYMTDDSNHATQLDVSNTLTDGLWHSVIITMTTDLAKRTRTIKLYMDGALTGSLTDISLGTVATITDTSPLLIGGNNATDFNLTDLRIYKRILSDGEIANDACSLGNPNLNGLTGYWPLTDGGTTLANGISGNPDFKVTGPIAYAVTANSLRCNLGADNVSVQNVTIAPQIFYWLGIPIDPTWGLEGSIFLSNFETELQ